MIFSNNNSLADHGLRGTATNLLTKRSINTCSYLMLPMLHPECTLSMHCSSPAACYNATATYNNLLLLLHDATQDHMLLLHLPLWWLNPSSIYRSGTKGSRVFKREHCFHSFSARVWARNSFFDTSTNSRLSAAMVLCVVFLSEVIY